MCIDTGKKMPIEMVQFRMVVPRVPRQVRMGDEKDKKDEGDGN